MMKSLRGCRTFLIATCMLVNIGPVVAGTLKAYMFEDVVLIWKSQEDLERAADLIARENVKLGDLDHLVACWANSGQEVEILSTLSDGLLLKIRVRNGDCEGIVVAEEFKD